MNRVKRLLYEQKNSKVKHFLDGSRLPNVIISLILLKVVQVMIFNIECPNHYAPYVCLRPKLACNLWQLRRFMGTRETKEQGAICPQLWSRSTSSSKSNSSLSSRSYVLVKNAICPQLCTSYWQ